MERRCGLEGEGSLGRRRGLGCGCGRRAVHPRPRPGQPFAGGLEDRHQLLVVRRRFVDDPVAPQLGLPVAQPEHAGVGVGRIVDLGRDDLLLAAERFATLDDLLEADGALVEAVRHLGVGQQPAVAHGLAERGVRGHPVVDGARAHLEELRKLLVGGAEPAIVARLGAVLGFVAGGLS